MIDADNEGVQRVEAFARRALSSETWCHLLTRDRDADERVIFEDLSPVTRRVRGRKMRDWHEVFDEFASAWQFGEYFGENGMAFQECLGDLDDFWPTTTGFVVILTEPEQVLADEQKRYPEPQTYWLGGLVSTFRNAAEWYAEPIPGEADDPTARPALSFDVVLVTDAEHRDRVAQLWREAGAPLADG